MLLSTENIREWKYQNFLMSDNSRFVTTTFSWMRHRTLPSHCSLEWSCLFLYCSQHQSMSAIWHTSRCHSSQTLTIMVLEFPPRESCSRRVSLEFLYGTCVLLPSTRAEMTFPNVDRERLILVASFRRWPVAPVLPCLSDPWRVERWRN